MADPDPDVLRHLPLKPLDFSVLLVLAREPSYGYGIVKAVGKASGGSVRLAPGNLYQVVDRMTAAGLVREAGEDEIPAAGADDRRRYYAITPLGRRVAEAEAARLEAVMGTVRSLGLC